MTSDLGLDDFPYEGVSRGTFSMGDPQLQQIPKHRSGKTVLTEALINEARQRGVHVVDIDSLPREVAEVEEPLILDDADTFPGLRPYQKEAMDKLKAFNERFVNIMMFPHRYGTGRFAKSGGGQSTPRFLSQQTWAAGTVNVDTRPVRTITGLWEAKKTTMYYHVQSAFVDWFRN